GAVSWLRSGQSETACRPGPEESRRRHFEEPDCRAFREKGPSYMLPARWLAVRRSSDKSKRTKSKALPWARPEASCGSLPASVEPGGRDVAPGRPLRSAGGPLRLTWPDLKAAPLNRGRKLGSSCIHPRACCGQLHRSAVLKRRTSAPR